MKKTLIDSMPLHFEAAVIELTSKCNAHCGICYQSSGPVANIASPEVDLDTYKRVLGEIIKIEAIEPYIHLAGGEVMLFQDKTLNLISYAKKIGFLGIAITTNGFWGEDSDSARCIAKALRESGLTRIEVSWDYWHKDYISGESIKNVVSACKENNIETTLRMLTTTQHSVEESIKLLPMATFEICDCIVSGPVLPIGRACKELNAREFWGESNLHSTCHAMLNFTIQSTGEVSPCCAGFDATGCNFFGNVNDCTSIGIYKRMNNSLLLRALVFYGPGALVQLLENQERYYTKKYTSMCDLCWSIFSSPKNVEVLQKYFSKYE